MVQWFKRYVYVLYRKQEFDGGRRTRNTVVISASSEQFGRKSWIICYFFFYFLCWSHLCCASSSAEQRPEPAQAWMSPTPKLHQLALNFLATFFSRHFSKQRLSFSCPSPRSLSVGLWALYVALSSLTYSVRQPIRPSTTDKALSGPPPPVNRDWALQSRAPDRLEVRSGLRRLYNSLVCFLGVRDVVSSMKAKTDSNDVCYFSTNSLWSSLRVFLTVPNSVRFCPSRNMTSACDLKKLSVVILRLET